MPKNLDQTSGRVTLRMPPELHAELVRIAKALGIDTTGLINMMIRDSLPIYMAKANLNRLTMEYAEGRVDLPKLQEAEAAQRHLETVRSFDQERSESARGFAEFVTRTTGPHELTKLKEKPAQGELPAKPSEPAPDKQGRPYPPLVDVHSRKKFVGWVQLAKGHGSAWMPCTTDDDQQVTKQQTEQIAAGRKWQVLPKGQQPQKGK